MDLAQKPVYKLDLAAGTSVVNLTTPLVEGDDRAQTFTLELSDKGTPANLDGYSVAAYFGRGKTAEAEADTIPLSGTVSGNVATITLTESCYSRSCYFSMPIRLSNGATGQKRTYLIVHGTVVKSVDGTIIDPDGSVPSLDDLFAQIAVMERSRQAAEEATEEALAAAARADEAREGIQGDLAALSEEIARNTAPAIIPKATGSIVSITDGASRPAVEFISHIEPAQSGSGNPAPDNVRPISGWEKVTAKQTGRNMVKPSFDTITTDGITFTANDDGSVTISGTAGSTVGQRISDNAMDVFLSKGHNYHFFLADAAPNAAITLQVYVDGQSKLNSQDGYLTIPETATSAYIRIRVGAGTEVNETIHPMVTLDDNTSWEAGHAQTFTADLPETVYGGKMDWAAGELSVTHKLKALDGTEEWAGPDRIKDGTYRYLQSVSMASDLLVPPTNDDMPDAVSSHFVAQPYNALYNGGLVGFSWTQGRKLSIRCNFETAEELNAYLAAQKTAGTPVTIAYHVTNPQKVTFTPQQLSTLKGTNNVWSDCGDTTLSYIADTKLYIDQKHAAIAAATL